MTIIVDFLPGLEPPNVGDDALNWVNKYPVLFPSCTLNLVIYYC